MNNEQIQDFILKQSYEEFVGVRKIFLNHFKNIEQAYLMEYLLNKYKFHKKNNDLYLNEYFYLTVEDLENNLYIKKDKQQRIFKSLLDEQVITIEYFNIPRKRYITINFLKIASIFSREQKPLNEPKNNNVNGRKNRYSMDAKTADCTTEKPLAINNIIDINKTDLLKQNCICANLQKNDNKKTQKNKTELLKNENEKNNKFIPPLKSDVFKYLADYCQKQQINISNNNLNNIIDKYFTYYETTQWRDNRNKKIKSWKLKALMFLKNNHSYTDNKNLDFAQKTQQTINNINNFVANMQNDF